jgi:hypothetical protein
MTYLASHLRPYRYKGRHRLRTPVAQIAAVSLFAAIWLTAVVAGSNAIGAW